MGALTALLRAFAVRKAAAALALRGGQESLTRFSAPWPDPWCDAPVEVNRSARRIPGVRHMEVMIRAPCRHCPKCLQFRQMRWRERALFETILANRTWALTLTFSPVHLAGLLVSADGGELVEVERRAYRDVQLYLKRLRKTYRFRYLATFERGEISGRAHYHMLLHETGRFPIPKRAIEDAWPSHVHARLVDPTTTGAASYVTKYLTKDLAVRPRASAGYGAPKQTHTPPPTTQSEDKNNLSSPSPSGGKEGGNIGDQLDDVIE